jgi:filamentous hemagglutinin
MHSPLDNKKPSYRYVVFYSAIVAAFPASGAELPVPCLAGSCGASISFSTGNSSAVIAGNSLTVNQAASNAVFNWTSFNISADGTVTFKQPDAASIALNRIFQADPSRIFGTLNANGRIFLINQNGILFGDGAKVNVGGLVASSLDITPDALEKGIAAAVDSGKAAFTAFKDESGITLSKGIDVARTASITTPEGGQVLMFAPEINNRGSIHTPGGQTVLAAGGTVYLATSTDPNLRGLLVEVDVGGTVNNGDQAANASVTNPGDLVGQIVAERGNVTLAGLTVNQLGRVSATTSVRQNGTIRLQAREGIGQAGVGVPGTVLGTVGGDLQLGSRSVSEVTLDTASTETTVDANAQPRSAVSLVGGHVSLLEGSRVTATGGTITAKASEQQGNITFSNTVNELPVTADASRLYIAPGAVLDVSGASTELPMERNVLRVELRGSQLADSPIQRDGVLRGQTVFVDVRQSGTRADGTIWQGSPLGDLSGDLSTISRSVTERNLVGGSITLQSQGDVIVADRARLDVSGGSIDFKDGYINTTQLLGADGRLYDISIADPNRTYAGMTSRNGYTLAHPHWGVTETFAGTYGISAGQFEAGYVEGKDAGSVNIAAPRAILDGNIVGETVAGRYQRQPARALPNGQVYRSYTELPRGAQLALGLTAPGGAPQFIAGDVTFGSGLVLPTLLNDEGNPFDPRLDLRPETFTGVSLRADLFGAGKLAEASIIADGKFDLPQDIALSLPAGAALNVTAREVAIDGRIEAPSGTVKLTARTNTETAPLGSSLLRLGEHAQILARGSWVNDSLLTNSPDAALAPLHINGGTVSLSTDQGNLILAPGSLIDVSAGAQLRRADSAIVGGKGGSISLAASPINNGDSTTATKLDLGAELRGYALQQGGALSITANEICISMLACAADDPGVLWLQPQFFQSGGFGSYSLTASRAGLSVMPRTVINLEQDNLQPLTNASMQPTGSDLFDFAPIVRLSSELRKPTNLSLRSQVPSLVTPYTAADFADLPHLGIAAGALIYADAGAAIALQSDTRMSFDGSIYAPSGSVSMLLDTGLTRSEFLPSEGIWLGNTAVVDVSGGTRIITDQTGLRHGDVLQGGTVSITARHGYIVTGQHSLIDASGTAADLDLRNTFSSALTHTEHVGSAGGAINFAAAEGMLLNGGLQARAGDGVAADGLKPAAGTLTINLDGSTRDDPGDNGTDSLFPTAPRSVVVSQHLAPVVVAAGTPVPAWVNGEARVSVDTIAEGGFGSVNLIAGTLQAKAADHASPVPGSILFDGDINWSLGERLVMDAAAVRGTFGNVSVSAPYMMIGHSEAAHQETVTPESGPARLDLSADFLEVVGSSVLQGFGETRLASSGDIRLRGVQPSGVREIVGSLMTAGDLTLAGDQVFASTLTHFEAGIQNNVDGLLRIVGTGQTLRAVLSAASSLKLSAPHIVQAGVLRAPFGSIELAGEDVALTSTSLTSTSAAGLTIPFGSTQGGVDWVYELKNGNTLVYGAGALPLPAQEVRLNGTNVDVQSGARLDLSGGGDMLAYEFIKGTGGSRDVLSALERPNRFAILPGLALDVAPYDEHEYQGSTLRAGDSIHIAAAPGLPAGEYVLLPARYALLPGAFLVSPADGYADLPVGESIAQLNGSTIVSGFRTLAGTGTADSRSSGFAIAPAALALREAQYTTSSANKFFADQAARTETAAWRLPRDAGVLGITAGTSLHLDGNLLAAAGDGGRGAAVDISAAALRVVPGGNTSVPDATVGEVLLDADSLNHLGAESLLLGGSRASTDDGTLLQAAASTVTVGEGAHLAAPELLLVAGGGVRIESGAELEASGAGPRSDRYLTSGDGALIRVASGEQAQLVRKDTVGVSGTLDIAEGARIRAPKGAVAFDSTLDAFSRGELLVQDGSLSLNAALISVGDNINASNGFTLSNQDLGGLGLRELVLASRSTVDLYGNVDLPVNRLVLDATGLRSLGAGESSIHAAESLRLMNSSGQKNSAADDTGGHLLVNAQTIEIGDGPFLVSGFSSTTLSAAGDLLFDGNSQLETAGDLELASARVSAAAGATASLETGGMLRITSTGPSSGAATAEESLGARLSLTAAGIVDQGKIFLPAGSLTLTASGGQATDSVTLGQGALIDVRGRARNFDGIAVAAPGGDVVLSSYNGAVQVADGAVIDVRGAAGGGDAGHLGIRAANGLADLRGQVLASAENGTSGGRFDLDAQSFGDFATLNRNVLQGGFTEAIHVRQRGAGDLVVAAGEESVVRAHDVSLVADQGGISVRGAIDARGSRGGQVQLAARDNVTIDGSIRADASAAGEHGGTIQLSSDTLGVLVNGTATISAAGAEGGELRVRVPRESAMTVLDGDASNDLLQLAGTVSGAKSISLEGFKVYEDADGSLPGTELEASATNLRFGEAQAFMDNASAITRALGRDSDAGFRVLPGVEIRSIGNLTLAGDWDLSPWRFNGVPGVLTLRAAGDLLFNSSLSDGFASVSATRLPAVPGDSWSYRLVGGADLDSADVLSVRGVETLESSSGNLRVGQEFGAASTVRTGNGDIAIAAAGDFELGNSSSVVYTAGVVGPGILLSGIRSSLQNHDYPIDGGDLSIFAGGNILGAQSDQFVTDWLWRAGRPAGSPSGSSPTAWTIDFASFRQNVAALGGGDVRIVSGGDITNLSASIPSIGRQVGGTTVAANRVEVVGGGHLDVRADKSILGGSYYVGLGSADIRAGDAISAVAQLDGTNALAPILGLGDAQMSLVARTGLTLSGIGNPTLLPQGNSQFRSPTGTSTTVPSFFSTYSSDSQVTLASTAGDVRLANESARLQMSLTSLRVSDAEQMRAFRLLPPGLRVAAISGDMQLDGDLVLYPAPKGNVEMFAGDSVIRVSDNPVSVILSDADPQLLPNIQAPVVGFQPLLPLFTPDSPTFPHASVPVHSDADQPDHVPDDLPARIVARNGDIDLTSAGGNDRSFLYFSKAARITAGTDVIDLPLAVQHTRATDVSTVTAGRDIRYSIGRTDSGQVEENPHQAIVDGPGTLELAAGRDIDLQASGGIVTQGNIVNAALSPGGASISAVAGLNGLAPHYAEFMANYLGSDSAVLPTYSEALVAYVERELGLSSVRAADALGMFRNLDASRQRAFIESVFISELRASGRAAASGTKDFTRAFAAIEALFPGGNPDLEAGEKNAYAGDIRLYFSRMYTLAGGDINLFAPGGEINAGLATPPTAFGIAKPASLLGLVAQSTGSINAFAYGDFQVNESRVFAADGGNILVWSTQGDIDAGRGAKTAISAPPPTITIDSKGRTVVNFPPALTGSGIQTLATSPGRKPGDVDLFAPRGVVNAGDAGIVAGNLTIAATAVLGANNIQVSGTSVGVPVDTGGLAASLTGVSNVASGASNVATATVEAAGRDEGKAPLADSALGWLDVFVEGFGAEVCKPDDAACLQRNQRVN